MMQGNFEKEMKITEGGGLIFSKRLVISVIYCTFAPRNND